MRRLTWCSITEVGEFWGKERWKGSADLPSLLSSLSCSLDQ